MILSYFPLVSSILTPFGGYLLDKFNYPSEIMIIATFFHLMSFSIIFISPVISVLLLAIGYSLRTVANVPILKPVVGLENIGLARSVTGLNRSWMNVIVALLIVVDFKWNQNYNWILILFSILSFLMILLSLFVYVKLKQFNELYFNLIDNSVNISIMSIKTKNSLVIEKQNYEF